MFLIDTHTHLYLDDFNKDRDLLIKSAVKKNIKKFFLPNIDSKTIDSLINLTKLYPNKCYPMIGLHPCSVNNDYINDFYLFSFAKHFIVSPSSFHWWGAWLNQNPNKICVRPSDNLNPSNNKDFWPESWSII